MRHTLGQFAWKGARERAPSGQKKKRKQLNAFEKLTFIDCLVKIIWHGNINIYIDKGPMT